MSPPGDRSHLRPVPTEGAAARQLDSEPIQTTPGLTPPRARAHSGRFITDVIVDLGYVSAERVQQIVAEARTAGRSPESLMIEQGLISTEQLSRAVAERYGLDHVDLTNFQVDMGAANLVSAHTARRLRAVPISVSYTHLTLPTNREV